MCSTQVPTNPPPASAGPRVSAERSGMSEILTRDELKAQIGRPVLLDGEMIVQPVRNNVSMNRLASSHLALHDALAAANARIAVLEARDVLVQALSVPLGKLVNTHGRVQTLWDASLESGELDEGDFDTAMNDLNLAVDEMYEGCYETVHARRPERLATASPEPGAAHE